MIPDVDASLRALLQRDAVDGSNVEISFEAPTKDWASRRQGPTLSVYLYDIREDLERRLRQPEEYRDDRGMVVDRRLPPRYFKLSYLITAWTQRPEDEHRLLTSVLGTMIHSDALPPEVLQGSLEDITYPVKITAALPPPKDRALSDVWTALGGELKPSLDVVVSAPFETEQHRIVGPPVLEEPRLTVTGPEDESKTRGGRQRRGKSVDAEEPAPAEEVVRGGKEGSGREFTVRMLDRPK